LLEVGRETVFGISVPALPHPGWPRTSRAQTLHDALGDPRRYEKQIDQLLEKYLLRRHLYEIRQEDASLAGVIQHGSTVARLLAKAVARGEYQSEPARVKRVRVDGKEREFFSYRLTDCIVHGVVAAVIREAMGPTLSPGLYSYRKGVSWWTAVSSFAGYVRAHRKRYANPRERGIYVLRRDVDSYADSIPVGSSSVIWPILRECLSTFRSGDIRAADWRLIEKVVQAEFLTDDAASACLVRGVATGQPIATVLYNLYLSRLDHELDHVPGAYFARYSDDIIFAHPEADAVQEVDAWIPRALSAHRLRLNEKKGRTLYLTAAGRASSEWPEATGATWTKFLGMHVSADGTVSLGRKAMRVLLVEIEERAVRTARAMPDSDRDRVGRLVCSVINQILIPGALPFSHQGPQALLHAAVTDRRQLAQLDYWIARIVLRAVTGHPNVRAFRAIPYRKLRQEWNLVSLLHTRNNWAGGRA
jgi:hypothetical protein